MDKEILPLIDFSKVKKKRKLEEQDNEEQEDQDLDNMFSVKKKNKKKKPKTKKNEKNIQDIENEDPNNSNGAYSYDFLLKRLYNIMKDQKDPSTRVEINIPNFILSEGANRKTTWANFGKVADALGRSKDHILSYIYDELSVEGTLGGEDQLYFKSKVTQTSLKNAIHKYITDYIRCPNCKSLRTILRKDQSTRLPQIYCEDCKGEKTIKTIKSRGGVGKKKK